MAVVLEPELLFRNGRWERNVRLAISDDGRVLSEAPPGAAVMSLHRRAVLPGMVNAHSHAFQRVLRGRTEFVAPGHEGDDFWSWRELMYRFAHALSPDALYAVSRQAFLEMALAGITSVGEFHYLHRDPKGAAYASPNELARQVIRAARDVGLRICLLRVGYARAGFDRPANPRQVRFIDPGADGFLAAAESLRAETREDAHVTVGLAPHSVRAVPKEWLQAVAQRPAGVVHMHVAEQPGEVEACLDEHRLRPVELLESLGLLQPGFTAVHAVHLLPAEARALGAAQANVCACPSTERNLGDGVVPADMLVDAGVTLSFGSDSQTSVDLLDEARQLESHLRLVQQRRAVLDPQQGEVDGLARRLFGMATTGGARSLGLPVGELQAGRPADFFTVDLDHVSLAGAPTEALLPALVFGGQTSAIRDVAVSGRFLVRDGQHLLEEETKRAYRRAVEEVTA